MSGINYNAAAQINADTAGHTGGGPDVSTTAGTSPTEMLHSLFSSEAGRLGFLFGHTPLNAVATPLGKATDSVRGALGGLVPRSMHVNSVLVPIVDGNNNLEGPTQVVPRFTDTLKIELDKLRRSLFGV